MRSPLSARRLRSRPPRHDRLEPLARFIDLTTAGEEHHFVVYVEGHERPDDEDLEVGLLPLELDVHPFDELAGFVAPESWSAMGLRTVGTATYLDDPDRFPERIASTVLLDRHGRGVSVLRRDDRTEVIDAAGDGTLPDTCRRALGRATSPAPPGTAIVWTLAWLDRLLEAWSDLATRRSLRCFAELARRHPVFDGAPSPGAALTKPTVLVGSARELAAAWSWERLRHEPTRVRLPGADLPEPVTTWMDDGFYARWAMGSFPPLPQLTADLAALLGEPMGRQLQEVVLALLQTDDDLVVP